MEKLLTEFPEKGDDPKNYDSQPKQKRNPLGATDFMFSLALEKNW